MELPLTEGRTSPIPLRLISAGAGFNLTGLTVQLLLIGNDQVAVNTTGNVVVVDAPNGKVEYAPDATDLLASKSPYSARFKVTDALARVQFFPEGPSDVWKVYRP